ncbi:MAG: type II toxin-antitoxin system VapC family toxin [Thermodesulfobacteriota bacterium]
MKKILFDSYAILCFYQDEKGADEVERLLITSRQGEYRAFISEINLGEVHYKTVRRMGLDAAREQLEQFSELPIECVHPSSDIIVSASELKAEHAISYADCFALATALKTHSSIVTGDPEFHKVKHLVEIMWL